jgi:hypothetical protein
MTEMTRSSMASVLAPEFDDFLFAPIGEERNGMLLSVISALARLDIDPWQEAANLAQLPGTTATRRLASLIASLPDRPSPNLDPGTIAARLIARLPRRASFTAPQVPTLPGVRVRAVIQSQPFRFAVFILMVVVLGGLSIAASQLSAARVNNPVVPASSTIIPPTSPPNSGQ